MKPVTLSINHYKKHLRPRSKTWHKGLSGHVLIIGGDEGYTGAPRMAGEAALRVGAGLVTIATRAKHAALMNIGRPEIMCSGVDDGDALQQLIVKADVLVLGPGLSQTDWAKMLWQVACDSHKPMVVDADGLNLLATHTHANPRWILTPHPGEAARLLNTTAAAIQADRLWAVQSLVKQYGGVAVLKGHHTLVCDGNTLAMCKQGNPGMATAGMGDVLSGVIGGLLAQGLSLIDAASLGVCLHASAGDLAAKTAGERGMLALDLMPYLRKLVNR